MQALVERGVDVGRLSSRGYGPDRPIADNATDRGRRANRRVEVYVIE
jgi:outer membrane protein OmpA-like peptidoglycan-associated protein